MRYYHLGVVYNGLRWPNRHARIQEALRRCATDWMRYSDNDWIVYAASAEGIHIQVREAIRAGDGFLVLPVDITAPRQGLLPTWIWDWLDVDRSQPGWRDEVSAIIATLKPAPPPKPELSLGEWLAALNPPKID
jgi:hypothetical protein